MALNIRTSILMEGWGHRHDLTTGRHQIPRLAYPCPTPYYSSDSNRENGHGGSQTENRRYSHRRESDQVYHNRSSDKSGTIYRKSQSTGEIPPTSPCVQWRSGT